MMNEVIYIKCLKNRKNPRILYKGSQILKMDNFKMSKTQKKFPLYKKNFLNIF